MTNKRIDVSAATPSTNNKPKNDDDDDNNNNNTQQQPYKHPRARPATFAPQHQTNPSTPAPKPFVASISAAVLSPDAHNSDALGHVRSYARLRPLLRRGHPSVMQRALTIDRYGENTQRTITLGGSQRFTLSRVFEGESQAAVYAALGAPLVDAALAGIHSSLIAYGPTGAGKTFTLGEAKRVGTPEEGVVTRTLRGLYERFDASETAGAAVYNLRIQYLQVHLEQVYDLLAPLPDATTPLRLVDDPSRGVYVAGANWRAAASLEEALAIVAEGAESVRLAHESLKRPSALAHTLLTLEVRRRPSEPRLHAASPVPPSPALSDLEAEAASATQALRKVSLASIRRVLDQAPTLHSTGTSRLTIAELAGAESASRVGVVGGKPTEVQRTGASLLAVGNVVAALARTGEGLHHSATRSAAPPPFGASSLTQLLREPLGDNCRTTVLVCASPALSDLADTRAALQLGVRAAKIRTHAATPNTEIDVHALAEELQSHLAEAGRALEAARGRAAMCAATSIQAAVRARARARNNDAAVRETIDQSNRLVAEAQESSGNASREASLQRSRADAAEARADAAEARAHSAETRADIAEEAILALSARLSEEESKRLNAAGTSFVLLKHGPPWRGRYPRTLRITTDGLSTYDTVSGALTNSWPWEQILEASASPSDVCHGKLLRLRIARPRAPKATTPDSAPWAPLLSMVATVEMTFEARDATEVRSVLRDLERRGERGPAYVGLSTGPVE